MTLTLTKVSMYAGRRFWVSAHAHGHVNNITTQRSLQRQPHLRCHEGVASSREHQHVGHRKPHSIDNMWTADAPR